MMPDSGANHSDNPYESPGARDDEVRFVEVPDATASYRIGERTVEALAGTQPWVRLIGWLVLLVGAGRTVSGLLTLRLGIAMLPLAAYRLTVGVICFAAAVLLLRYASSISDFTISRHIDHLDRALEAQRAFWRFLGVAIALSMLLGLGIILLVFWGAGSAAIWNVFQ